MFLEGLMWGESMAHDHNEQDYIWYHVRDWYGNAYSRCSGCGGTLDGYVRYKYCPYCGARKTAVEANINDFRGEPKMV